MKPTERGVARSTNGTLWNVEGLAGVAVGDGVAFGTEGVGIVLALTAEGAWVAPFDAHGLEPGAEVTSRARPVELPVGASVLGRVLDVLGRPLDGGPAPTAALAERAPLRLPRRPPAPPREVPRSEGLATGMLPIDLRLRPTERSLGLVQGPPESRPERFMRAIAARWKDRFDAVFYVDTRGEVDAVRAWLAREGLASRTAVLVADRANPAQQMHAALAGAVLAVHAAERGTRALLLVDDFAAVLEARRGLVTGAPFAREKATGPASADEDESLLEQYAALMVARPDAPTALFASVLDARAPLSRTSTEEAPYGVGQVVLRAPVAGYEHVVHDARCWSHGYSVPLVAPYGGGIRSALRQVLEKARAQREPRDPSKAPWAQLDRYEALLPWSCARVRPWEAQVAAFVGALDGTANEVPLEAMVSFAETVCRALDDEPDARAQAKLWKRTSRDKPEFALLYGLLDACAAATREGLAKGPLADGPAPRSLGLRTRALKAAWPMEVTMKAVLASSESLFEPVSEESALDEGERLVFVERLFREVDREQDLSRRFHEPVAAALDERQFEQTVAFYRSPAGLRFRTVGTVAAALGDRLTAWSTEVLAPLVVHFVDLDAVPPPREPEGLEPTAAMRLLRALGMHTVLEAFVEQALASVKANEVGALLEEAGQWQAFADAVRADPRLARTTAQAYADHFSDEEVSAAADFFESETGTIVHEHMDRATLPAIFDRWTREHPERVRALIDGAKGAG